MAKLKFIPIETLLEIQENQEDVMIVDVLSEDAYKQGHIPGAMNIPTDQIEQRAQDVLDKSKPVVTYCASYACPASTNAARKLLEMGYTDVLDYKAGKQGWTSAGLELAQ
jgi:rhodanese-related sulfurtransferase